jgi:hypothetical protein
VLNPVEKEPAAEEAAEREPQQGDTTLTEIPDAQQNPAAEQHMVGIVTDGLLDRVPEGTDNEKPDGHPGGHPDRFAEHEEGHTHDATTKQLRADCRLVGEGCHHSLSGCTT